MGLFKHHAHSSSRKAEYSEKHPALQKGIRSICDAWEADVFRSRRTWLDREPKRAQLADSLANWMEEEVIPDHGMISSMDNYADALTTQLGEGLVDGDPELYNVLSSEENEEQAIQDLARPALEFTQNLCNAEGENEVQALLRQTEERAGRKVEASLVAE